MDEVEARREEYDTTADKYDEWSQENLLMQKYSYYSTIAEMEKEGVEGKTFLEVGCGPCPIGQQLALLGAKKIIGLDISSEMLERARKRMADLELVNKFEFVCDDIFNEKFQLPEKVDCVVLTYILSTCVNNYEMLAKFFSLCATLIKDNGYVLITDFSWIKIPNEGFWAGMYTTFGNKDTDSPKEFEPFNFFIDKAPDQTYKIFNLPSHLMFKAGHEAGFSHIEHIPQYPDPTYEGNKVLRRYLDICKSTDYLMKFKIMKP